MLSGLLVGASQAMQQVNGMSKAQKPQHVTCVLTLLTDHATTCFPFNTHSDHSRSDASCDKLAPPTETSLLRLLSAQLSPWYSAVNQD